MQPSNDELQLLKAQILEMRAHSRNEHRRLRVLGGLAVATVAAAMLVSNRSSTAIAQSSGSDLTSRVAALEHKTQFMGSDSNTLTTTFSGCNLRVVDGSGSTWGAATDSLGNGLGNIIIGYNEHPNSPNRTGWHNLIVGDYNNYSSYGGIVAGTNNAISGDFASVTGGAGNSATGTCASVTGGSQNSAQGQDSAISGGSTNTTVGINASVSGGVSNLAQGSFASVTGGYTNKAWGNWASISGGSYNAANGYFSTIAGGDNNVTNAQQSAVTSGRYNVANGQYSAVTGGNHNMTMGAFSSICGGYGGSTSSSALSSCITGGYEDYQNTQNGWMGGSLHSP